MSKLLKGETIIYFGPEPWEGLWRNRHQLMSRFARHNDVYYVEPPTNIRHCLRPGLGNKLFTRDVTGVTVIHGPRWLPVTGRPPFKHLSIRLFLFAVALVSRTAFGRKAITWYSKPQMIDYVDKFSAKRTVYHVVDEYGGYVHPSKTEISEPDPRELRMLRSVDTVVVVTASLFDSKSPYNENTHIVANAVDFDAYADEDLAIPQDMAGIEGPIIGYSGLVAARLDLQMLREAAVARTEWNFVFVGAVNATNCKPELNQLRKLPNVHMLGAKPVDQVPRYVHAFDVCIIPYLLNLRAQHASPLKLYEYAAASKPIVSTDFTAARAFEGHVRLAGDAGELLTECEAALQLETTSTEIVENRHIASGNTWEHRVEQLSGILFAGGSSAMNGTRPHVLYVAEFSTGGSMESLLTLIGGLDKELFRLTVLFYKMPDAAVCKRVQRAGAEVVSIYPPGSEKVTGGQFRKHNLQARVRQLFGRRVEYAYKSLRYAGAYVRYRLPIYRAIRAQLEAIQPDIVHFNSTVVSDTPGIQAARACGIPAISHVRNLGDVTYLSVMICRRVKAFICISTAVQDFLVERGIDAQRCTVVPNAVDLERFSATATDPAPIREEFGWDATDKVIALVGRIVGWKGHDYFVRAIADARRTDPSIRALIVGDDSGPDADADFIAALRSLIEELDLGDAVRFSGRRTDAANIMKAANAVVCASSKPEPFGRVIIESMAVGTPVIATDAGGAADIIENGVNGILVPIRDSDAMAEAVLRLIRDDALVSMIRSAGLRSVSDRYTVATHVDRISRLYRSILESQQA